MHQNRINESSNMLHYSNASSIEENRRYLVIKGGACLVALARERGRQLRSRTGQQQRRSRSLPERRGRNNEYQVNICISMHDMSRSDARRALTWYEEVLVKGETSGKVSPVFRVFGQRSRRGKVASLIC